MLSSLRIHGALFIGAVAALIASPAGAAPSTVNDDVRCLLLSTSFGRLAKDDNSRRAFAMTASFYLGRLSDRIGDPAVAAAIRAQGKGMAGTVAEPIMRACAARATATERAMSNAVVTAQGAH